MNEIKFIRHLNVCIKHYNIIFWDLIFYMRDLLSDLNNYMPDRQNGDMRQKPSMMSTLPVASARLSKL